MHIGFFQAGYPRPDGTTTSVQGLALALAKEGHLATIYGCGVEYEKSEIEDHPNVQQVLSPSPLRNPFRVPSGLRDRLSHNSDGIDLLVINTMFNPPNLAIARSAMRGGIPYLISPHDPYHPELLKKNRMRKQVYAALFERPMLQRAVGVQVLSPDHIGHVRHFGISVPTLVIPNGFNPSLTPLQLQDGSEEYACGAPRFLALGRLDLHHKGLDLLIQAFAASLNAGRVPPSALLNFVGPDGGDLAKLREIVAQHKATNNIRFFGRVSDETRWAMLRQTDIVLLCSRYDGFGYAALEGMLCGKPIIVSREAGIAAYVAKAQCGWIVDPSCTSIAAGMATAQEQSCHWKSLGERGRQFAYENLTWEKMGVHAASCYKELLNTLKKSSAGGVVEPPSIGDELQDPQRTM